MIRKQVILVDSPISTICYEIWYELEHAKEEEKEQKRSLSLMTNHLGWKERRMHIAIGFVENEF